jgi:hypothetical protein
MRTGAVAVCGMLALAAGSAAATTASTRGWRIVTTIGASNHNEVPGFFTATGPHNAFSSWRCAGCARSNRALNFIRHWNGRSWRRSIALPAVLNYPTFLVALGASSASDLWAFTTTGKLGVWNGSRWAIRSLPTWVLRPTRVGEPFAQAAIFSPGNAWVFSIGAITHPALAAHYRGGVWRKVSLPGAPVQISPVAPNDIWAVGFALKRTSTPWVPMHWNGSAWRTVALPKVKIPPGDSAGYGIVAVGARDVWLPRLVGNVRHTFSVSLLHWTGRWHVIKAPASIVGLGPVSQDGHGGLWMEAEYGDFRTGRMFLDHYGAGRWSRQPIPAGHGARAFLGTITWIPGTRSLWAAVNAVSGSQQTGEILKYGP